MAKTKAEKKTIIGDAKKNFEESSTIVFTDYKGSKVKELTELRRTLREFDAQYRVVKKRLLRVVFKERGIEFDPTKYEGQLGIIFGKGDISSIAQPAYKFNKKHKNFKILGGFDVEKNEEILEEDVIAIGKLPSREVMLTHVLGGMVAPIRAFMYLLQEKSKTLESN